MAKKSTAGELVRSRAEDIPRSTPEDLARLRAAMEGPIDTSDIPEIKGPVRRIKRDASGRLPKKRESPIRDAILAELGRRAMTRYQLWQEARALCETLPRSAVYEYLRGQREIGVVYVEALMQAIGLVVGPKPVPPRSRRGTVKS